MKRPRFGALDPILLDLLEKMRERAMYPECFDVKTALLMLFGMRLMDLSAATPLPPAVPGPVGKSCGRLSACASCSAANRGAEILANVAKREADAKASAG